MKVRETLILSLILSLAVLPILAPGPVRSLTQTTYGERLDVYTAGSNAFWSITVNQLNGTLQGLAAAESGTGGLTSYRLTALSTQNMVSDFQIFGPSGYNLLGVPYLPSQGLFLRVNATSASSAAPLVSYFAKYFGTNFTQVKSGSGSFTFFASVDFAGVAVPLLYRDLPAGNLGFAAYVNETTFLSLAMPTIELTGTANGSSSSSSSSSSSFAQSLTIGAASSGAVAADGLLSLSRVMDNITSPVLAASPVSNSTQLTVHASDGLVFSSDPKAKVTNDASTFSGQYQLALAAGAIADPNVTVTSQIPTVSAYRLLNEGTLNSTQPLAVTVVVKNTEKTGAIQNVTVNDNWWKSYPSVFQVASGNYSFTIPTIAAGGNATETYVLKVVSTAASQVIIPAAHVDYGYVYSNQTFHGSATLNEAQLQVNGAGTALSVVVQPSSSSGAPLGTNVSLGVTVTNLGDSPALNLKFANATKSDLVEHGGIWSFSIPVAMKSLLVRNFTETYTLQWSTASGQQQNMTANSVSLLLSHSAMLLPFVTVTSSDTITSQTIASKALNVSYTFSNKGLATASPFNVTQAFPSGVTCANVTAGKGTCSNVSGHLSTYSYGLTSLVPEANESSTLLLKFANDNYIVQPAVVNVTYLGIHLQSEGGPYVIPAGLVLTKTFSPDALFPEMVSNVTVGITNTGSLPLFNLSGASGADSFDTVHSGTPSQTYDLLAPQQHVVFNYSVTMGASSTGNLSASAVQTSFIFGGMRQGPALGTAHVVVYKPVTASVTTTPSTPEENHDFTITIKLTNPAVVPVTDVTFTLPVPAGLSLVSGGNASAHLSGRVLTVTVPTIGPNSTQVLSARLTSGMSLTLDTSASTLTFHYLNSAVKGSVPLSTITVIQDVTTRYTLPIVVAILLALGTLIYLRRRVGTDRAP